VLEALDPWEIGRLDRNLALRARGGTRGLREAGVPKEGSAARSTRLATQDSGEEFRLDTELFDATHQAHTGKAARRVPAGSKLELYKNEDEFTAAFIDARTCNGFSMSFSRFPNQQPPAAAVSPRNPNPLIGNPAHPVERRASSPGHAARAQ